MRQNSKLLAVAPLLALALPTGCSTIQGLLGRASSSHAASGGGPSSGGSESAGSASAHAAPQSQAISENGAGPTSAQDYHQAMMSGAPSVYEPQRRPAAVETRIDGYLECSVWQTMQLNGAWTETSLGCASQNPTAVRPYRVPSVPARWRAVINEAAAVGRGRQVIAEDAVVVPVPGASWEDQGRDEDSNLPRRTLDVRVYNRGMSFDFPACGVQDGNAVCEPSGSNVATGFNVARYRLQEAQRMAQAHRRNACRAAAWQSWVFARGVKDVHAGLVRSGDWAAGKHYATRYDGVKDEAALFRAVDETEAAALALFRQCGGAAEPPVTSDDGGEDLIHGVAASRHRWDCVDVNEGDTRDPRTTGMNCAAHGASSPAAR